MICLKASSGLAIGLHTFFEHIGNFNSVDLGPPSDAVTNCDCEEKFEVTVFISLSVGDFSTNPLSLVGRARGCAAEKKTRY